MEILGPFNSWRPSDAYASVNYPSLVPIMACHLAGTKPLSEPERKSHWAKKSHMMWKFLPGNLIGIWQVTSWDLSNGCQDSFVVQLCCHNNLNCCGYDDYSWLAWFQWKPQVCLIMDVIHLVTAVNALCISNMEFVMSSLTHWGRDKMDAISQTTFSNAFCWMRMFEYRLKFHWSLFLRVQLTISQHWFR